MRILRSNTKMKKFMLTKIKKVKMKASKVLKDFGSKIKRLISKKYSDGKFYSKEKIYKNGLRKY